MVQTSKKPISFR